MSWDALSVAASGMEAQARRLLHVSENMANADTPGYRRKTLAFHADGAGGVRPGPVRLDDSALPRIHEPSHPLADGDGYYEASNVDLIVEIADARQAQRSYEANLRMFDQARQMRSALLDLLRR
ncbi:MAG: flagellar basal body rod protein FlgC [Hasllibacter sp.]